MRRSYWLPYGVLFRRPISPQHSSRADRKIFTKQKIFTFVETPQESRKRKNTVTTNHGHLAFYQNIRKQQHSFMMLHLNKDHEKKLLFVKIKIIFFNLGFKLIMET